MGRAGELRCGPRDHLQYSVFSGRGFCFCGSLIVFFVQCLLLNVFVSCDFAFIWAAGFTNRHVCWLLSRPFYLFMRVRVFVQVGGVSDSRLHVAVCACFLRASAFFTFFAVSLPVM